MRRLLAGIVLLVALASGCEAMASGYSSSWYFRPASGCYYEKVRIENHCGQRVLVHNGWLYTRERRPSYGHCYSSRTRWVYYKARRRYGPRVLEVLDVPQAHYQPVTYQQQPQCPQPVVNVFPGGAQAQAQSYGTAGQYIGSQVKSLTDGYNRRADRKMNELKIVMQEFNRIIEKSLRDEAIARAQELQEVGRLNALAEIRQGLPEAIKAYAAGASVMASTKAGGSQAQSQAWQGAPGGGVQAQATSESLAALGSVFEKNCYECHSNQKAEGKSELFPDGVNLQNWLSYSAKQRNRVAEVVDSGKMPKDRPKLPFAERQVINAAALCEVAKP